MARAKGYYRKKYRDGIGEGKTYRRDNWSSYDREIAKALCNNRWLTKTDFNRILAWIPTDNRNRILAKMMFYGQITYSHFTRRYKATDRLHKSVQQERYV